MNIIDYPDIRQKYFEGFDRAEEPNEIVIHGTGGGASADAILKWMLNGERGESYKKGIGLFHFLIDFDGTIYQIIEDYKWVYHSDAGKHDAKTIGIELMNNKSGNKGIIADAQYNALSDIIVDYVSKDVRIISNHDANRKLYSGLGPKGCPGNFDFVYFYKMLAERLNFERITDAKIAYVNLP